MLMKIKLFYFFLIKVIKSSRQTTIRPISKEPKVWYKYLVIGISDIGEDSIKKDIMIPAKFTHNGIEKCINCCFSKYNKQIFDLSRIDDIYTIKNNQAVIHTKLSSNIFKIIPEPYTEEVERIQSLISFKKTQFDKPEPFKTIYLLLVSKLMDFIGYFDEMIAKERDSAFNIFKLYHHHEIYTYLNTGEINDYIKAFIKNEIEKNEPVDVISLCYTSSEHKKIIDIEKFKNLFKLFVKELFVDSYKKYADESFEELKDDMIRTKQFPFSDCSILKGGVHQIQEFVKIYEMKNFLPYERFKFNVNSTYNEFKLKGYENVDYHELLNLVYIYRRTDRMCKKYVFLIDINNFNRLIMYFNSFMLECEKIEINGISKKLDEVLNSLLHVFFCSTSFIFNLSDTDFKMCSTTRKLKQREKIKINIGCEFKLSSTLFIDYILTLLPTKSIILENIGKEIISKLIMLYHIYTSHALIYFFNVSRSDLFNLALVGQYAYATGARKFTTKEFDTFKPNLAVNIEHMQDLAKQIVTLLVNLNIKCYEELSKRFISDQDTINPVMNITDTNAKITGTMNYVKLKYNI
ncbi:hypothetical protein COBT_000406 [Conglomerata obtusa]